MNISIEPVPNTISYNIPDKKKPVSYNSGSTILLCNDPLNGAIIIVDILDDSLILNSNGNRVGLSKKDATTLIEHLQAWIDTNGL